MKFFLRIIKTLVVLLTLLFMVVAVMTIDAAVENVIADNQISDYISRGVYERTVDNIHLYQVESKVELEKPSINFNSYGYPLIDQTGDIFVTRESVMEVVPYSSQYIMYNFGGHAGIIYSSTQLIETTGMNPVLEDNVIVTSYNDLLKITDSRAYLGLRVDAPQEDIDKAVEFAINQIGMPYNYSFVFNKKNSFYCTDLVSRSYSSEAGLSYNLDNDGVAVSVNDLIISNDTFITFYRYVVNSEIYLYYSV